MDIAIIGLSCRLPDADNYDEFWNNLRDGKNCIHSMKDRWNIEEYKDLAGSDYSHACLASGQISGIDKFDNQFFCISPNEARHMDPQQRILLEETWRCIEDSGIPLSVLQENKTSVYVGSMAIDYYQNIHDESEINRYSSCGVFSNALSGRISYFFDFKGKSETVDTACSSTLSCLDDAVKELQGGYADFSIVAGVNINANPSRNIMWLRNHMLSVDGQCKSFDASADGFVSGEGIGCVLVRPYDDAVKDKNHIYGVIKGINVVHSGRTVSLTAPDVNSQTKMICDTYSKVGFKADTVNYIEAHGSGTSLGDPIEVEALTRSYKTMTNKKQFCFLGTVKGNVGHLESASGMAGLVKVLMMLKHHKIPSTLNVITPNPIIDFKDSPFLLADKLTDWKKIDEKTPLRAGISSFGLTGVGAHVLIEEFIPVDESYNHNKKRCDENSQLLFLSAKSKKSLLSLIDVWKEYISTESFEKAHISDICKTLSVGREQFNYRLGFVVKNKDEIKTSINSFDEKQIIVSSDTKYGLYIGEISFEAAVSIYQTFKCNELFGGENFINELIEKKDEASKRKAVFYIQNYLCDIFKQLGVQYVEMSGSGLGCLCILVQAGCCNYKKALEILEGKKSVSGIKRPNFPIYCVESKSYIYPNSVDKSYIELCFEDRVNELYKLKVNDQWKGRYDDYCERAVLLMKHQYTFKKFMQEWEECLKKYSVSSLEDILNDHSYINTGSEITGRKLMMIILIDCLCRVYNKWKISEKNLSLNVSCYEIVKLIEHNVIDRNDVCKYYFEGCNDDILKKINSYGKKLINNEELSIMKKTNENNDDVMSYISSIKCGSNKTKIVNDSEKTFIVVDERNVSDVKNCIDILSIHDSNELMLRLWSNGNIIPWRQLYCDYDYNKLQLPVYQFNRDSFWVEHNVGWNKNVASKTAIASCVTDETGVYNVNSEEKNIPVNDTLDEHSISEEICKMAKSEIAYYTEGLVKDFFAKELQMDIDSINSNELLSEFGIDSITVEKFNEMIAKHIPEVSKTILFECFNLNDIVEYLLNHYYDVFAAEYASMNENKHNDVADETVNIGSSLDVRSDVEKEKIVGKCKKINTYSEVDDKNDSCEGFAVIGMSGRFPGANNVEELWDNLKNNIDCISDIPEERWNVDDFKEECFYCKKGGFIKNVDKFDAEFFNISAREAVNIDPQERIMLETSWNLLEDAGMTSSKINKIQRKVGVFIGAADSSYQMVAMENWNTGVREFPNTRIWSISNRISYFMNFNGPSLTVDTACSSSMMALKLAINSLRLKECKAAIVGGVSLLLHPAEYAFRGKMNMLSKSGHCNSFGMNADGFVPGEGAAAILIKPLSDAIKDKDRIYGVIKGIAVNHGGKTNGYTVPNPNSQAELIVDAAKDAGIDLNNISYIEAHGTGTSLGDPIEVEGLRKAFKRYNALDGKCSLGSIKSNIGHLDAASGITGVIKVLLQMKYNMLVKSLHSEELNPKISFGNGPFYVQDSNQKWMINPEEKCYAGVSSFGAGGTNAHVIIESYPTKEDADDIKTEKAYLITLSAKNDVGLKRAAFTLLDFVNRSNVISESAFLKSLSYTLLMGREVFSRRLAFIANDLEKLKRILNDFLNDNNDSTEYYLGDSNNPYKLLFSGEEGKVFINSLVSNNSDEKLAMIWTMGFELDNSFFGQSDSAMIISLPSYSLNPKTYWVGMSKNGNRDGCLSLAHSAQRRTKKIDNNSVTFEDNKVFKESNEVKSTINISSLENIVDRLRKIVADILYLDEKDISDEIAFHDIGMDSILGVQLVKKLEKEFGVNIDSTVIYNYSNILNLSVYLSNQSVSTVNETNKKEIVKIQQVYDSHNKVSSEHKNNVINDLVGIVSDVLYLEKEEIDINESLFDLGLDSVLNTQLVNDINKKFDVNIDISKIYLYSNIVKLSEYVNTLLSPKNCLNTECNAKASEEMIDIGQYISRLNEIVSEVLFIKKDDIDIEESLYDMGLDSILGVELVRMINKEFGIELNAADIYKYVNIKNLAFEICSTSYRNNNTSICSIADQSHQISISDDNTLNGQNIYKNNLELDKEYDLMSKYSVDEGKVCLSEIKRNNYINFNLSSESAVHDLLLENSLNMSQKSLTDDVAIIGLSGRFPGADNIEEFWNLLLEGKNSLINVPDDRFVIDDFYDEQQGKTGKTYCRNGGFINNPYNFDCSFFHISPFEAERMNPQQRLFLEEAWHAIEDAGYDPHSLSNTKCGVYVGAANEDYDKRNNNDADEHDVSELLGNSSAFISGRIAYYLNLKGPAVSVNTACSSSLVALHQAVVGIRNGDCTTALAGGVSIINDPALYVQTSQGKMLSKSGRCHAFDEEADGFVISEGVVVFLLKKLSDALKDNDHIYGIIRGAAVNQDGKSNGITAPSESAQESLEKEVFERYHINPAQITYVEAHGTGTKLGDPIEFNALRKSFEAYTNKKNFCAIGSVKSNVGHSLACSGAIGLAKLAMCLKNKVLVPEIEPEKCNSLIDISDSPFYFNKTKCTWNTMEGYKRMGTVSSFGLSGTNCFMVVEEASEQNKQMHEKMEHYLFLISGYTEKATEKNIMNLLSWIKKNMLKTDIGDAVFTLSAGRNHFNYRAAFVVKDFDELCFKIENRDFKISYVKANLIDEVNDDFNAFDVTKKEKLDEIAEKYLTTNSLNFSAIYEKHGFKRISMPLYAFECEKYCKRDCKAIVETNEIRTENDNTKNDFFYQDVWDEYNDLETFNEQNSAGIVFYTDNAFSMAEKMLRSGRCKRAIGFSEFDSQTLNDSLLEEEEVIIYLLCFSIDCPSVDEINKQFEAIKTCQSLFKYLSDTEKKVRVFLATKRCQQVFDNENIEPNMSAMIGLIKVAMKEYLDFSFSIIDVTENELNCNNAEIILEIFKRLKPCKRGEELAYRSGKYYIKHIKQIDKPEPRKRGFEKNGVYVILGGAGGVGSELSLFIAKKYKATVILIGRRAENNGIKKLKKDIISAGGQAEYYSIDATDEYSLQRMIESVERRYGQIKGAIHSAIYYKVALFSQQSLSEISDVLSPKILGTYCFAKAFSGKKLDFFMYFSSGDAYTALLGHSAYVAGCTFEDRFAMYQRIKESYPVHVINWGFWKSSKSQIERMDENGRKNELVYLEGLKSRGIQMITPDIGTYAVDVMASSMEKQIYVLLINNDIKNYFDFKCSDNTDSLAKLKKKLKNFEKTSDSNNVSLLRNLNAKLHEFE